MKFLRIGIAACVIVLLLGPVAGAQKSTVTIGAMYNLTGGQRDLDQPSAEGARLAVAQANADGGLLGRPVRLLLVDGKTEPKVIAAEAAALFSEVPDIAGVIGFSDTDMVLAAAPIAAQHRRVFVTSGATSPELPEQIPDYLFLACFGDNVQAAAGAEWAYDQLKARMVAVLYKETSSYARLLHQYFQVRFKELGGTVIEVVPYQQDTITAAVGKVPKADLIYLAAQPDDVAAMVPALRTAGIDAPILGGDGLDIGAGWHQVKDAYDVYFTTHAYISANNPDPRVQAFREAFLKAYPGKKPDAFAALGYDAARLLMAAIKAAGRADPNAGRPETVRQALAQTHGFEGVTGTISYPPGSRIPSKPVAIIAINQGAEQFIGSFMPKKIPAP